MLRPNTLLVLAAIATVLVLAGVAAAQTSGGPDAKGYRWKTDGNPYVTIIPEAPVPTQVLRPAPGTDAPAIDITPLGFTYYGQSITRVYVNNNGFVSFGGTPASVAGSPHELPDASTLPGNVVAGCWAPYLGSDPGNTNPNPGMIYYQLTATRLVVEWFGYQHAAGSNVATFQIILHSDGIIEVPIQQCMAVSAGNQSSGIEDNSGNHGLSYRFGTGPYGPVSVRYYPNKAPVAVDDLGSFVTNEDTAAVLDVLANDSEPDGDALTITGVTAPLHGTAQIIGGGTQLRYTPAADSNDNFRNGDRDWFRYTVSDPYGKSATVTVNISVVPVNDAPTFTALGDVLMDEDTPKTITGWLSAVLPGPATALDEVADQNTTIELERVPGANADMLSSDPTLGAGPSHSLTVTPAENQNGFQTWRLKVTDNATTPATTQTTFLITVTAVNDAPSFTAVAPGVEDDLGRVVRDPLVKEGTGPHRFSVDEPWVQEYAPGPANATDEADQGVYFSVAADNPGLFSQAPSFDGKVLTFRIKPHGHGTSMIHVTVWDDAGTPDDTSDDKAGNTITGNITAWPVNDPPVARDDKVVYLLGQGNITVDVLANDTSDPDTGETLRLDHDTAFVVSDPLANVKAIGDDTIQFNMSSGTSGIVTVVYTIEDDGVTSIAGGPAVADPRTATGTLRVHVSTLADVGRPDRYTVVEDGRLDVPAEFGVAANDVAPAGLSRTVFLAEAPPHGEVLLRKDGSFVYTPEPDYSGPESFYYYLAIGDAGQTPPVRVDITVSRVNDLPLALQDDYTVPPGESSSFSPVEGVLANDIDPDGDKMTARLVHGATHGTVVLNPDGGFKYTPPEGFLGLDLFRYEVRDTSGQGGSAVVHINVKENTAPWADFRPDRTTTAVLDPVEFTDMSFDPDGDIRRWRWDFGNGDIRTEQHVTYVFSQPGEYRIRLTVWDDSGASSTFMRPYMVTYVYNPEDGGTHPDPAPIAHAGPDRLVLHDTRVQLGCRITPEISCGDNFQPAILGHHWEQIRGPVVDLSDKDVQFPSFMAPRVPADGEVELTFELTIFDGQRISEPSVVNITVQDRIRPVANAGNPLTVRTGSIVNLHGAAVGFDDDAVLTYTWRQVNDTCGVYCPDIQGIFVGQDFTFRAPDVSAILAQRDDARVPVTFTLTVTDGIRTTAPDRVVVSITHVPEVLGFQHRAGRGLDSVVVAFSPRQETIPGYVSSQWEFGDGNNSTRDRPTHVYAEPGLYTVTWNVTLEDGRIQTFQRTIEVGQESLSSAQIPSKAPVGALLTVALVGTMLGGGTYAYFRYRQGRQAAAEEQA